MIHFEALSHLKSMMLDDANQKDLECTTYSNIHLATQIGLLSLDLYRFVHLLENLKGLAHLENCC